MYQIKHIESGEIVEVTEAPTFTNGIWECGNQRFTDPAGDQYESIVTAIPPVVSPVQFKLLFTSAERVAIEAVRATDSTVKDFYSIIDDPRLTEVDLALKSVQDALSYLAALGLLAEGRKEEIISGVAQ